MRVLPQHKHQKLILQCYPPGKVPDKKPNPSELSYLLYYASTRRIKLEKVIDFLDVKTKRDVKASKSGNLHVTLAIVSALIDKCADNLNVFASQTVSILLSILTVKELPLARALVATYGVLCGRLDGGLFSGDKAFVDSFTHFLQSLVATGNAQAAKVLTNKLEWKMVAILTSRHVFNCLGFNAQISLGFVGLCVPLLADTLLSRCLQPELAARLNTNLKVESEDKHHLSRTLTGRSARQSAIAADHFANDCVDDGDIRDEALTALRTLFNTSHTNQIQDATVRVVEFNFTHDVATDDSRWGITLLELCASWIPVQLRFVALSTLLSRLSAVSDHTSSGESFAGLAHTARSVTGLVSSSFNMIGLSISDVIQQLLVLQTNLHVSLADYFSPQQVATLSATYSECVVSLSSHIYYFDQVQDAIEAILVQTDSVLVLALSPQRAQRTHGLVVTLLDTIATILTLLLRQSSSISRNHASLENWDLGLQLLTVRKVFPEFASAASPELVCSIEKKFLDVFNLFLHTEFRDPDTPRSLAPDYADYISNPENIINNILLHAGEYLDNDDAPNGDANVTRALVQSLVTLANITGINFAYNFAGVFHSWRESTHAKDTVAYVVMKAVMEAVDKQYSGKLRLLPLLLVAYEKLLEDIAERKRFGFWVNQVDGNSSVEADGMITQSGNESGSVVSRATQKDIYDALTQTGLTETLETPQEIPVEAPKSELFEDASDAFFHPQGYGLGTANDINSIHSSLVHGNGKINILADLGLVTQDTLATHQETNSHIIPRVSDLKRSVNDPIPRAGALPKINADVGSILSGLDTEEDKYIVV